MKIIKVIAAKGVKVPLEHKPNTYISDAKAVEIEMTTYYRRRIADADLLLAQTAKTEKNNGKS